MHFHNSRFIQVLMMIRPQINLVPLLKFACSILCLYCVLCCFPLLHWLLLNNDRYFKNRLLQLQTITNDGYEYHLLFVLKKTTLKLTQSEAEGLAVTVDIPRHFAV